jgi:hypothetical protein
MDYSIEKKKALKPSSQNRTVPRVIAKPPVTAQQPAAPLVQKIHGKKYTEENIQELLSEGYINVHPSLWDQIPVGAHVRYVKRDVDNSGLTHAERFKPGGYVRNHTATAEGKKLIILETRQRGRPGDPGYSSFPVAYEDIEELYKKYDKDVVIEIHLIYTSLAQKKKQIEDLEARIKKLEDQVRK